VQQPKKGQRKACYICITLYRQPITVCLAQLPLQLATTLYYCFKECISAFMHTNLSTTVDMTYQPIYLFLCLVSAAACVRWYGTCKSHKWGFNTTPTPWVCNSVWRTGNLWRVGQTCSLSLVHNLSTEGAHGKPELDHLWFYILL